MFVKKVDLYLIKNYFSYFLISLIVVAALFLFIDVLSTINRFSVSGQVLIAYYFNYLPWILSQMQPVAGVLATVFLFVGLQKNRELVIFHALGLSLYRVLTPLLLVMGFLAFSSWAWMNYVVPKTMEKRNYYYYVEMKKQPAKFNRLKQNDVWFRTSKAIVNFGKVVSESRVEDVKVIFFDKERWAPEKLVQASYATLNADKWIYQKGSVTHFDGSDDSVSFFDILDGEPLEDLKDFKKRQSQLSSLSLSQLSYAIEKAEEAEMSSVKLKTEYQGKLSFIFSALFLSMLVLPFCIGNPRSSNVFVGLAVALMAILLYWVSYSSLLNFGKAGVVPPVIAGWGTGVFSLFISWLFLRKQVR